MKNCGSAHESSEVRATGLALFLLVAGTFFMENLDATVIMPAIPAMADSFSVRPADLNIGVSAYMLALGLFIPISGWAAERFGARRVFALVIAIFTLASMFCGLAYTLPQFVSARILQGIGGALMVPVGRLVVLRTTAKDRLIKVIAILTWPALVAPVLGPPLGGLIVDHAYWRWIFWLNLPLGAIALILSLRVIPPYPPQKGKSFDWTGFLLMGGTLLCLMLAVEIISRPESLLYLAALPFLAGTGLMAAGVRHANRIAHPVFDLNAFRYRTFAVTIWGGSLFRMGVSAVPFLIPLMFQIGFGYDGFSAGLMLIAVFAGNLLMKPATTPVLRQFGFRPVLVINGLINAVAIVACATFTTSMPVWVICIILFIGGMSRSMQFTALNTIAFADIPQSGMASANTLFSKAFQLAMGLGIALGAVAWRIGDLMHMATDDAARPFRIALVIVGIIAAFGVLDSWFLAQNAGERVSRQTVQ